MFNLFQSRIALNVKGRNINRFIKKLTSRKIDILSLKYINKNELNIVIYKKDYEKVLKIKSIYDILETDVFGPLKLKKIIKINKHLLLFLLLGFTLFLILTNIIFKVEVVHNNKEIRTLILKELENYNIEKYKFKKSYKTIQKIKKNILNKYPDKIEWLEIEEVGTKYIVRLEEREILNNDNDNIPRNVIAKKDAVIKKILADTGEVIKRPGNYVKKGDTIVSGQLYVFDKERGRVKADAKVYGEVWYVLKINYPFVYYEEKETGRKKENYVLKVLNKDIDLSTKSYKNKKYEEENIISHPLLPIKLVYQKQKEVKVINEVLTFDEALSKAQEKLTNKIKDKLKENEYIINSKYLKSNIKDGSIEVEMFFAICEDITDYQVITNE